MAAHDVAIITTDDIADELADTIIESVATEIEVKLGDKLVHLAMLRYPDHWAEDWEKLGVEDVDEFLSGLVEDA